MVTADVPERTLRLASHGDPRKHPTFARSDVVGLLDPLVAASTQAPRRGPA
jgi:hypothetical protein